MKVLFIQTNYSSFLENFYAKHKGWKNLTHEQLLNLWTREWFGTSNFYSKNLKKFGWRGKEVIINDWNSQSKWAKEHSLRVKKFYIPIASKLPPIIKNFINAEKWISEILLEQIIEYQPDVVYSHDVSTIPSRTLKKIKQHTKLLVGQKASPLPLDKSPLYEFDLLITSFPHFVKQFKKMGINSEYLGWCVEKSIPKIIGKKKRIYEAVYIGGLTPHHRKGNKILEDLARKVDVDFWGYGEKTLLPNSPIRKKFHGQAWGKDMYKLFARGKIVVNRHIDVSGDYANNMRMFEATAMGALLITDAKKNIEEFFKVDKEIVTYKNSTDLINKVKYYLKHDKERKKIAKAGKKRTLKNHIYDVRMKKLDKIIRKHLKQ